MGLFSKNSHFEMFTFVYYISLHTIPHNQVKWNCLGHQRVE